MRYKTGASSWTRKVRALGLLEWVCEHGVGHPDRVAISEAAEKIIGSPTEAFQAHACDGCCSRDDFPGRACQPQIPLSNFTQEVEQKESSSKPQSAASKHSKKWGAAIIYKDSSFRKHRKGESE